MSKPEELVEVIKTLMQEFYMPVIQENISQEVARGIEEAFNRKVTRMESIEKYLILLYDAQKSGHDSHKEITIALEQFRKEAGI